MSWHSLHVHYHGADVDSVILDAVRPLFATVRGHVRAAYFVRHWRQGPHLRLNLCTGPDTFKEAVYPDAERIIGGFLAIRPSRAGLDPGRLLPLHRRLAALERDDGPLLPWHPDNSMHVRPYERRLHVLGSAAAADLLADFLAATTELAFAMTEHVRRGGQRLRLAFDLMVAVAHASSHAGLEVGFVSYRSHAEGFLCAWPGAGELRAAWNRRYREHTPALLRRVRAVLATVDGATAPEVPFAVEWIEALRSYQARAAALIEAGEMSVDPPPGGGRAVPTVGPLADVSTFHAALDTEWLQRSPWFAVYRVALNYTYLQLTRLGVTPVERFLLCHLIANAAEEIYGVSAMDIVAAPQWRAFPPKRSHRGGPT